MRISSDKNSPNFTDCYSMCKIFLAGAERSNVITADEAARYALTWRPDEHGNPVMLKGKLQTEAFHGDVRIDCPMWLREEIRTGIRIHGAEIGS